MIWDLHVHVAGVGAQGTGNRLSPKFRRGLCCRFLAHRFRMSRAALNASDCDQQIARFLTAQIDTSAVDRAVLLALDAAYHPDGSRDDDRTLLVADNDFVADLALVHEKVLFGASLHPYRPDALTELERLIDRGACLVKWLPGAQNIQAEDPRCFPFYDLLAKYQVPLLCHTGGEHILKAFPNTLNDPRRLIPALERGVTVIAAHCGISLMLHEKSYARNWREMALQYERFYGDISAFGVITHIWPLRSLLKDPRLAAKLVYGSDFPVVPMPLSCVGPISLRRALEIRRVRNPFDQSLQLMQAAGVPPEIFSRAEHLLRLPASKRARIARERGAS